MSRYSFFLVFFSLLIFFSPVFHLSWFFFSPGFFSFINSWFTFFLPIIIFLAWSLSNICCGGFLFLGYILPDSNSFSWLSSSWVDMLWRVPFLRLCISWFEFFSPVFLFFYQIAGFNSFSWLQSSWFSFFLPDFMFSAFCLPIFLLLFFFLLFSLSDLEVHILHDFTSLSDLKVHFLPEMEKWCWGLTIVIHQHLFIIFIVIDLGSN